MRSLWYTACIMLCLTFLALAYVEWQVPGFVSSVFPIYIVFVLAAVCGMATLVVGRKPRPRDRRVEVLTWLVSVVLAVAVLRAGEVFSAYRVVIALITLILPSLLLKAVADVKD